MQVSAFRIALTCTLLTSRVIAGPLPNLQSARWSKLGSQTASCSPETDLKVLLVLDPNGLLCWENVAINTFTNATLLPWLHDQRDALTLGNDRKGLYVQVSTQFMHSLCQQGRSLPSCWPARKLDRCAHLHGYTTV